MKDFKYAERVYYKFDEKHPYQKQIQNDSKLYGKGRVACYLEDGRIAVTLDNSNFGKSVNDPLLVFNKDDLLDITEYFKLDIR